MFPHANEAREERGSAAENQLLMTECGVAGRLGAGEGGGAKVTITSDIKENKL